MLLWICRSEQTDRIGRVGERVQIKVNIIRRSVTGGQHVRYVTRKGHGTRCTEHSQRWTGPLCSQAFNQAQWLPAPTRIHLLFYFIGKHNTTA